MPSHNNRKLNKKQVIKRRQARTNRSRRTNGDYSIGVIKNAPIQVRSIRYQSPTAPELSYLFRTTDLLSMIGFTTSTTVGYSMISAVKIKSIALHILPDPTDVTGSATFTWLGIYSPNNESTMTFMNAVPASYSFYPLEGSLASFWLTDTTTADDIFQVSISVATPFFMDIHFSYVMPYDSSATTSLSFSSALASRVVYPDIPRAMATGTRMAPTGLYSPF